MPNPWHQPPRILPNYGKKRKSVANRTNVTRVLLHDNVSQQQLLDTQIGHLKTENERITKLIDLHKKSFIVRQSVKQQQLRALGITHVSFLPDIMVHDAIGYLRPATTAGDNREKKGGGGGDNREKGIHRSDKRSAKTGHHHNSMPPRSLTMIEGKNTDVSQKEVELPNVKMADRSKSAVLPQSLTTFSTHDFNKLQNVENGNEEANNEHPVKQTVIKLPSSKSSSSKSSVKSKRNLTGSTNDPRFKNLESSLVRTDWPVGGYTQLSPCGSKILKEFGQPLFDYDTLHSVINHYNNMPTPRRATKGEGDEETVKPAWEEEKAICDNNNVEYVDIKQLE